MNNSKGDKNHVKIEDKKKFASVYKKKKKTRKQKKKLIVAESLFQVTSIDTEHSVDCRRDNWID